MAKFIVTNTKTGQYLKTVSYENLLQICRGDKEIADDCIRYCRIKPERDLVNETWTVVDDDYVYKH